MKCRLCKNDIEVPFLSLGNLPLANSYISNKNLYKKEDYYPLNVYVCNRCLLVQVDDFVSSDTIFTPDYAYFSSYSTTWNEHCKRYVDMIVKKLNLDEKSRVIEIGSNDGCLLQHFIPYKIQPLGVDPAREANLQASKRGIVTHQFFFNHHYVKGMLHENLMDLIIANNVLAHNPNLNEFVQSMKYILKDDGTITMEFPHLMNIINYNQFDTIYHEHFSYFSFMTASKLFMCNDLEIYDVEETPTHGGSLRVYVKHKDDKSKNISHTVREMLRLEREFGLDDLRTYDKFKNRIEKNKHEILKLLISLKKQHNKIACYGAPAKGNTLLNYCGIGTDFIDYTVDINPHKQEKHLPGTHIQIKNPDFIKKDKPDYIIILPWNLRNEIITQLNYVKEWNGKFIVLIPEPEIITNF